jgi:hypothetical protein
LPLKDQNTPVELDGQHEKDQNEELLHPDATHVDVFAHIHEMRGFILPR